MLVFTYLINAAGSVIYPYTTPFNVQLNNLVSPSYNQITLIFYNNIANNNGVITPNTPVISGLSGTVQIQARTTPDSAWSNIQNGSLDISTGANMAFPAGAIYQINTICTNVTGCNYILVRFDMGV